MESPYKRCFHLPGLRCCFVIALIAAVFCVVGCADTRNAWPLAEAKATYESVPTLSQSDYAQAIAQQPVRPTPPASASSVPPRPIDTTDLSPERSTPSVRRPPEPLGSGSPRAVLGVGAECAQASFFGSGSLLVVAVFVDSRPEADLIFAARQTQAHLAQCLSDQGFDPRFETRLGQPGLSGSAEIWLY